MAASDYVPPQIQLFQEFQQVATAITAHLRACIVGPHAYLVRHSDAVERPKGSLGAYNASTGKVAAFPTRPAGARVDPSYTKVFIDDARLQYLSVVSGVGQPVAAVGAIKNQVRWADTSGGFKANGSLNPRYAGLLDRDVRVGDRVTIGGIGGDSNPYTLETYVAGLSSTGTDRTAASIGAAVPAASNGAGASASSTVTLTTGTSPNLTLSTTLTNYSALADGHLQDTYTLRVLQGSTGGNLATARFSLTSASGVDDVPLATPAAAGSAGTFGSRGLSLTWTASAGTPDLVVGQVWTIAVQSAYVVPTLTLGGTYTGSDATGYIIKCTRGGKFSGTPPQITVSTTTGVDVSGPTTITAVDTVVPVGTRGVTVKVATTGSPTGINKGDTWTVAATPAKAGAYRTLTLANNLPPQLQGTASLDLKLSLIRDVQVPEHSNTPGIANWTQTSTTIDIEGGLNAYDPSWTSGGVPAPLPIVSGTVFVEYRAWRSEYVNRVALTGDFTSLLGPLHPDNPLTYGVYKALSASNGATVAYIGVENPDSLDSWAAALSRLVGRSDIYNVVALTDDLAVQQAVAAFVDSESSPVAGRWRGTFQSLTLETILPVVSATASGGGSPILGTFALLSGDTATDAKVLEVPAGNADFITNGVVPGDVVRTSYAPGDAGETVYDEFVVDEVITEDSIRLVSGPGAAIPIAQMIEVWHPLTKDEQALAIGNRAASFATRRVCCVWPDSIASAGQAMPGYFAAAALAGQVSGSAPHRPLTNVALPGFDDASRTTDYFNASQLNIMAGSGVWIVEEDADGVIKTRHGVTTDPTDYKQFNEVIRRNVDSICLVIRSRLAPLVGKMNITKDTLSKVRVELQSALEYLKVNGTTQILGSQLIDATIIDVRQDTLDATKVVAVVRLVVPSPMNQLEIHVTI